MSTYVKAHPANPAQQAQEFTHTVACGDLLQHLRVGHLMRAVTLGLALLTFAVATTGCEDKERPPLPIPAEEQVKPVPEKKILGRLIKTHPANITNALAGLTRGALNVQVKEAKLDERFTWLRVSDDTGESWAITPPLAATPTGDVTLTGWVRQRAELPLSGETTTTTVLWVAHVSGETVTAVESGEEAVIDPVFAAMELTGTVAQSKPPQIAVADHTIAALHENKTQLAGKSWKVRGQVIHVIPDLSGRTWWLLRDGATDDDPRAGADASVLLVAGNTPVEIGAIVLVEGTLLLDRAFTLTSAIPVMLMPAKQIKDDGYTAADDGAPAPEGASPADTPAADEPEAKAPAADAPAADASELDDQP